MSLSPLKQKKFKEFENHTLIALDFFFKKDFEHSLVDFRKSGEAMVKILILEYFGDSDGEKIICGEIDENLVPRNVLYELEFNEGLNILYNKNLTRAVYNRLRDLQQKTNTSAHNPNGDTDFEKDANLCKAQSYELTVFLYKRFNVAIPAQLSSAHKGDIDASVILDLKSSPWQELSEYVDFFSRQNRYILVAPPSFDNCSLSQLEILSRINWSFVLDFDPQSQEDGLYKAINNIENTGFIPLTIKQKGQRNIIGSGSIGSMNWVFANGIKEIQDTVTTGIKSWRSKKYHAFIKELLHEFFTKESHRYVVIYLWDEVEYIEEIVRVIDEIEELPKDLVKHVFISTNSDTLDRIEEFDKYDIDFKRFNFSIGSLINELSLTLNMQKNETDKYLVPARTKTEEHAIVDISGLYAKLLNDHISVVYQGIDQSSPLVLDNEIPPFYRGEQITWNGLSVDYDAVRAKKEDLITKLKAHLTGSKRSIRFDLLHKPGAGGSTLALRAGFELHKSFPTILIGHYEKGKTFTLLSTFLDKVNRPVLAIVESSDIGVNDIEDLIRTCNASKLIVCFLYVRRTLNVGKSGELSVFLNDSIVDISERDRFVFKANPYTQNKTALNELSRKQPTECDVIDFSLAINEEKYSKAKLVEYIKIYIDKLPENQVKFCTYVAFIYHYSQKSVSHLVFRSLFHKDLNEELRLIAAGAQYIRKMLIQGVDPRLQVKSEYWRPRFSKFAEAILAVVLGEGEMDNWKAQVAMYSIELIKLLRQNNEYLIDETHDLLKSIFFDRNHEDTMSGFDNWRSNVDNGQFSYLLRDVADKQQQRAILVALVDAYPKENHFLGHLGRFLYEKAEEESEFTEAESYINQALSDEEGNSDFNLQHLGGMCKRREIEFLKRSYSKGNTENITDERIRELANSANAYFNQSIDINPYNIHAYIAQIQMLIMVIDFGREVAGIEKREMFLSSPKHRWYLDQYITIKTLIADAHILIDNQETLGITEKISKAKSFLGTSEGRSYEIIGSYGPSREVYLEMIESAERTYRPKFRMMYVYSTLMAKVKGDKRKLNQAWGYLKSEEIVDIKKLIGDNILQEPGNLANLRMWFTFVRYSEVDITVLEIISVLTTWFERSEGAKLMHMEAAFYLYVLHAYLAIRESESLSVYNRQQAILYIQKCRELSSNTKFSFEFLGKGRGIDCLINHRERQIAEDDILERVEGRISLISSRQQGRITLESGLEAFFVPTFGNFVQGFDETSKVSFFLGFRHDGLFAFDVRRITDLEDAPEEVENQVLKSVLDEQLEKLAPIEEITESSDEIEIQPRARKYIVEPPKIVGKIDLSQIYDPKKKKK